MLPSSATFCVSLHTLYVAVVPFIHIAALQQVFPIISVCCLGVFSTVGSLRQPAVTTKTPTCPRLEAAREEYSGDV